MADEPNRLAALVAGAVGFAGGFAVGYAIKKALADDDRPPIIVRGGSLYFDNTTTKKPGRDWQRVRPNDKKAWELDHWAGKKVSFYRVYFEGAAGTACGPIETDEIVVHFDHDGDGDDANLRQYTVKIVNDRPRITSAYDMDADTNDSRRLVAGRQGTVVKVAVKVDMQWVECPAPTEVWVESVR